MKLSASLLLIASATSTGCASVAIEGARMTVAATIRNEHMADALAGDAEAQYKVGKSYCCAPRNDDVGFYDNRKATEYLCQAARRHHAGAAFELGKIHSGDTIEGLRLLRRTANFAIGDKVDEKSVASYWLHKASEWGEPEARHAAKKLGAQDISPFTDLATTPCTIDEVYGATRR